MDVCPVCNEVLRDSYDSGIDDNNIDKSDNLNIQDKLVKNDSMAKDSAFLLFKTIKQICESDKIVSDVTIIQ